MEEVRRLKEYGNLVPVYREIRADLETPVSAYLKIARGNFSFLLESVEGGERLARYSFIGTEPSLIIKTGKDNPVDPLLLIEKEFARFRPVSVSGLPRFHGGMVGYLSYEVAQYFEQLPSPDRDPLGLPESVMMMADTLLVFDHLMHKIKVVSHVCLDDDIEDLDSRRTLGQTAEVAGASYAFAKEAEREGLIQPDAGRGKRRKRYRPKVASWLKKLHVLREAGASWDEIRAWTCSRFQPGHEHEVRWPQGYGRG